MSTAEENDPTLEAHRQERLYEKRQTRVYRRWFWVYAAAMALLYSALSGN